MMPTPARSVWGAVLGRTLSTTQPLDSREELLHATAEQ